ncbi:lytic transglycosylase [Candidatus Neptunichlamydia sp. REUL1]|uniref:lytic transglycosylase n=1 Tax=Candidatus Neptunichlamydia sp. REUL1 TaxID=3064277 RepID=UPI00293161FC|nr:LysM peptidoglycan-binding domain-containing protein [Candidatus Neptunochlamydia sp. REUL1]
MNRRDIIIVAVLINTGLLVALFVSSLKKDQGTTDLALSPKEAHQIEIAATPLSAKQGGDQIDQVISQYTAMAKTEEKKEEALPPPVLTPTPKAETKTFISSPLRVVTVEKGDVLEKIARSHGISVDEIMKLNSLSNSRLQIGQELKLPERKVPKKEALEKTEDGKFYVVKGGDNPWTVAQKNGIQVDELLRLNNMDEEKAKRLRPGDRLRIK